MPWPKDYVKKSSYYSRNKEKHNEMTRAYWRKLKEEVIAAYGGRCACCEEGTFEFLTIDHVDGNGRKHRKGVKTIYLWLRSEGYPKDGFQLLCMNCNFAKGIYGRCPHAS